MLLADRLRAPPSDPRAGLEVLGPLARGLVSETKASTGFLQSVSPLAATVAPPCCRVDDPSMRNWSGLCNTGTALGNHAPNTGQRYRIAGRIGLTGAAVYAALSRSR